jgi:hypothetical protein
MEASRMVLKSVYDSVKKAGNKRQQLAYIETYASQLSESVKKYFPIVKRQLLEDFAFDVNPYIKGNFRSNLIKELDEKKFEGLM